ncbi:MULTISPECIES: SDR family oxidoreductase [unclassified Arcicella]|uniref:SDR family oxidoreductase n=1 Tax=unclassified Arcicella TaxID=2644986 RepID=UPI002856E173|nr:MULTISPECIES: SDR family oxidoreductase [unclassified Arcicella]MDR6562278.1 NADP-dependent 3-hydroxy acid dehydrogenase YdfG [Arcicella sp. BE51]MDR6812028.1 NADP-dependent 3-hydroxy acid dehydrogenase YdfG [Arcicella sp. BE140]MDR6823339.1 NADP-dependent 3-hydroxy acid dehydrogenase YdfG [Arcicella sp. BE139]
MSYLQNKVVFITGASSGIGKATALMLLEAGAKVFDFSRTNQLTNEISHENLRSFKGDVSSETDVKAGFDACLQAFGTVDALLNNAGLGLVTNDLSLTELDTFEQMFDVNVKGVFLCNREALKIMKNNKSGHILTVISMGGQRTNASAPVYCASKFGARGLSSGLADQALKLGIKVTDINPGPTDSNYWGDRQVAREKFLKVEDVAKVIVFVLDQPDYVLIREINFDNMKFLA